MLIKSCHRIITDFKQLSLGKEIFISPCISKLQRQFNHNGISNYGEHLKLLRKSRTILISFKKQFQWFSEFFKSNFLHLIIILIGLNYRSCINIFKTYCIVLSSYHSDKNFIKLKIELKIPRQAFRKNASMAFAIYLASF